MLEGKWDDALKKLSIIPRQLTIENNQVEMIVTKLAMVSMHVKDLQIEVIGLKKDAAPRVIYNTSMQIQVSIKRMNIHFITKYSIHMFLAL